LRAIAATTGNEENGSSDEARTTEGTGSAVLGAVKEVAAGGKDGAFGSGGATRKAPKMIGSRWVNQVAAARHPRLCATITVSLPAALEMASSQSL
jgi:hypothetical protein